jgi:hypothetical protein
MEEKRRFPRLEKCLPIKLSDSEFDVLTETKNISASGAWCQVDKPLKLMTKLEMVILIPFKKNQSKSIKKINCSGIVVRSSPADSDSKYPYYVGIYFSGLDERDRKTLRSYIDSFLQE